MTTQPVGTRRPAFLPPVRHPRGADHRVVSGPGTDMAGQRDDVVLGFPLSHRSRREPLQIPGVPAGTRRAGQVSYEL
jgi:hypothetical protein